MEYRGWGDWKGLLHSGRRVVLEAMWGRWRFRVEVFN